MSTTVAAGNPFQNSVKCKYFSPALEVEHHLTSLINTLAISIVDSFHPSAQQKRAAYMNLEDDVEKRLQAFVAKDRIRIKEFFIDFDKLRKGWVGEAAVSIL